MNLQQSLDVGTKAREFLEVLQLWGMPRSQAKAIVTRMAELLNDNTYPWKDLTMANAEETAQFLAGDITFEQASPELSRRERKQ